MAYFILEDNKSGEVEKITEHPQEIASSKAFCSAFGEST